MNYVLSTHFNGIKLKLRPKGSTGGELFIFAIRHI